MDPLVGWLNTTNALTATSLGPLVGETGVSEALAVATALLATSLLTTTSLETTLSTLTSTVTATTTSLVATTTALVTLASTAASALAYLPPGHDNGQALISPMDTTGEPRPPLLTLPVPAEVWQTGLTQRIWEVEAFARDMDSRLMLGLSAGGGFFFVCACAGCIQCCTRGSEVRSQPYDSLPTSGSAASMSEEERNRILAEVYGHPIGEDFEEDEEQPDLGPDEASLQQAWRTIQGAVDSDDEFGGLDPDIEEQHDFLGLSAAQGSPQQESHSAGSSGRSPQDGFTFEGGTSPQSQLPAKADLIVI